MEYTLIRKNNKRAYLRVKNGAVIVTAPLRMSKIEIDAFVEVNRAFIERNIKKFQEIIYLEDGTKFNVMGNEYTLKVVPSLKKEGIYQDILYVKNIDASLKKILKSWFYSIAEKRFQMISNQLGIKDYTLKVSFYKSKWGSCTPGKKLITLNAYLLFTSIEIIDAILYHEFAHTIHFDHSPSFYSRVLKWYPSYYREHDRLKGMNIPKLKGKNGK
ncbi:MAG: DUF45 domain-containing protein [Bacillota bacterium]|nr:DUF45 domain-containing protein [Bacillota bacterium]